MIKVCTCYDACIIAEGHVTVVVKLTLPNGEVLEIGKSANIQLKERLTSSSPPKCLKSIKEIKTGFRSMALCHYKGYTYVGQRNEEIDRLDKHGDIRPA